MRQQPDDPSIADSDLLWRTFAETVEKNGIQRVPSSAFKTNLGDDGEFSVNVARLSDVGRTFAGRPPAIGFIAEIEAGLPRSFTFTPDGDQESRRYTVYLWNDGSGNAAHAHVHPPAGISGNQQDRNAKIMAMRARIIPRP